MSEDEKEAVEQLKKLLNDFDNEDISENDLFLINRLIEKQREEIENNQKFKEDVVNLIMLWDKKELPDNEIIINVLDTFVAEASRLEDIEDRKIQVEVKFVEEKRDKYWKDKIKEKIKELEIMSISQDIYYDDIKEMFEELLGEEDE